MAKASAPAITVTAFGKHPAWADHIDNLPNPGPRLPPFKSLFYTNGIDPNVRRWTRQLTQDSSNDVHSPALDSHEDDPDTQQIRFGHRFCWWNPDAVIVGNLSPSSDLKQRRKYPLVLAAQCIGIDARWMRQHVWPTLDNANISCPTATSVEAVRQLLAAATEQLNQTLRSTPQPSDNFPAVPTGIDALRALCESFQTQADHAKPPAPHADPIEVIRFLYQVQRVTQSAPRAQDWIGIHLRLPALTDDALADMTLYQNAARHMTGDRTSVLTVTPDDQGWIDLVLGSPDSSYFLFLRSGNLPYCTQIAYNLDDHEVQSLHAIIDGAPPLPQTKEPSSGIFSKSEVRNKPNVSGSPTDQTTSHEQAINHADHLPTRSSSDRRILIMLLSIGGLLLIIVLIIVGLIGGL